MLRNIRLLRFCSLNPLSLLTTVARILMRLMLREDRLSPRYINLYSRLLLWRGIPLNQRLELFVLTSKKRVICPRHSEVIIADVYIDERYDKFLKPSKGHMVVDVGAHVGIYTVKSSESVGEEGLVIAIEPHPDNFNLLLHNLQINLIKNVIPLNLAITSYNGKAKLYIAPRSGDHSIVFRKSTYIEVQCKTLDKILNKLGIKRKMFIKIDVEGAEMEVLKGAKAILQRSKPKVVVASYHYATEAKEVSDFLTSQGFKVLTSEGYVYAWS